MAMTVDLRTRKETLGAGDGMQKTSKAPSSENLILDRETI
jgi:hypothetical protein